MDFLKAEIERKKKQIQTKDVMAPNKKYFKRGDLSAKQEEEYWQKHKRLKADHALIQQDQSSSQENNDNFKVLEEPEDDKIVLPRTEVIKRLRERSEPILLFAESEHEAFTRLKKLEILQPEANKGFKNDLKAAMDRVDQDYINEIMKSGSEESQHKSNDVKLAENTTTHDDLMKMSQELGRGNEEKDREIILKYLKYIIFLWGKELNETPADEKRLMKGKLASATHAQTVSYLKPLFRDLKHKRTQEDILDSLVLIVKHLLDRHYIKANEAYLEMAIGNAPWPIGVTMVGIHARTGREKIHSKNVAHVLNDETQRKYIQAIKRLMGYCQKYFPTEPSRSVNFERDTQNPV